MENDAFKAKRNFALGGRFMKILEVKNLSHTYNDGDSKRIILENVNVDFELGKLYSILGVSGSGKTTFLSLISSLDKIQSGDILFDNQSIKTLNETIYRSQNIGIIFQNFNLIPYLNAYQNIKIAMEISHSNEHDAYYYLNKVGITKKMANRKITHLSGGEQQRVAIARVLATHAKIIMADEPTGNLDRKTSSIIIDLFKKLAHEENKCVIVVTHSQEVAKQSDIVMELDSDLHSFRKVCYENNS